MTSPTPGSRARACPFTLLAVPLALVLTSSSLSGQSTADLRSQVETAERAFARTMADRDLEAFAALVAEDAVFFGAAPLQGREAVVEGWAIYFDGPEAPFSWEPEEVVVLASGTLAHSSGPVRNPAGEQVGTFNSVWRLEADGRWRVIFDKGCGCPGG